jgi:aldehyde:ferredoxin oxidoreductase
VSTARPEDRATLGSDPNAVPIPKRFLEVETWRGRIDGAYLDSLKDAYAGAILAPARSEGNRIVSTHVMKTDLKLK